MSIEQDFDNMLRNMNALNKEYSKKLEVFNKIKNARTIEVRGTKYLKANSDIYIIDTNAMSQDPVYNRFLPLGDEPDPEVLVLCSEQNYTTMYNIVNSIRSGYPFCCGFHMYSGAMQEPCSSEIEG